AAAAGRHATGELAAAKPHAERPPGLAHRDLRAEQARAVLALHRLQLAAGVEHHDGQWLQLQLAAFCQRLVNDRRSLIERQWHHFETFVEMDKADDSNTSMSMVRVLG